MNPIENVDLKREFAQAEEAILRERREEVLKKIRGVFGGFYAAEGSVKKLRQDLARAEEALRKQQDKLQAIQSGDWRALPDGAQKEQAEQ